MPVHSNGPADSPAENFFLDSALDVCPGFQLYGAGLDRGNAALNLQGPRRVGVRVCRTIQARQKFSGYLRAGLEVEAQGIGKNGFSGLGHKTDLTPGLGTQQEVA